MVRLTIERKSGEVVIIDRIDWGQYMVAKSSEIIAANREAAERDPSKGGRVISIVWIEPIQDAETLAWERIEDAQGQLYTARERVQEHRESDVGLEYAALARAEQALVDAKAEYVATYGADGTHMANERERLATDKARREAEYRSSFIARGLD